MKTLGTGRLLRDLAEHDPRDRVSVQSVAIGKPKEMRRLLKAFDEALQCQPEVGFAVLEDPFEIGSFVQHPAFVGTVNGRTRRWRIQRYILFVTGYPRDLFELYRYAGSRYERS